MNKKQVQIKGIAKQEDIYNLFKIVDKLEQRISTLEKVLASHAKCIGEIREDKVYIETLNGPELREEKQ